MTLEHVAIWTNGLEKLKDFYVKHFGGVANSKYTNEKSSFKVIFSHSGQAQDLS